jgi:hypothetical protein
LVVKLLQFAVGFSLSSRCWELRIALLEWFDQENRAQKYLTLAGWVVSPQQDSEAD